MKPLNIFEGVWTHLRSDYNCNVSNANQYSQIYDGIYTIWRFTADKDLYANIFCGNYIIQTENQITECGEYHYDPHTHQLSLYSNARLAGSNIARTFKVELLDEPQSEQPILNLYALNDYVFAYPQQREVICKGNFRKTH